MLWLILVPMIGEEGEEDEEDEEEEEEEDDVGLDYLQKENLEVRRV